MIIEEIALLYLLVFIIKGDLDNFNVKLDFIKLKGMLNNLKDLAVIDMLASLVI